MKLLQSKLLKTKYVRRTTRWRRTTCITRFLRPRSKITRCWELTDRNCVPTWTFTGWLRPAALMRMKHVSMVYYGYCISGITRQLELSSYCWFPAFPGHSRSHSDTIRSGIYALLSVMCTVCILFLWSLAAWNKSFHSFIHSFIRSFIVWFFGGPSATFLSNFCGNWFSSYHRLVKHFQL